MTSTADVRNSFLAFFKEREHTVVPTSPLVPANDPTLLFTNAGMVQFKDVFTGKETRDYTRATSVQRCVRAGGKHNDLENVGYTARHHTFFEMLGNFSFGDYFKREAIHFAWEYLTDVLKLPEDKLFVTVYQDDDEAADIWLKEIGVDEKAFTRIGDKAGGKRYESDNFWAMGDTGPCGPCSEIFYDHGPDIPGGPPGSPEEDGDRFIEIWNLVFMQYERAADGSMSDLPRPSVDTGMGLERLAAILQGVHDNYDIDLFQALINATAELAGEKDRSNRSLRVIADHIRSCAFLITDGVLPSNEGRGYVLRRIIRRAARHGHMLGMTDPFFYKLVAVLDAQMGQAYPELGKARNHVERVLRQEEERFNETLDHGLKILDADIKNLEGKVIPGEIVFKLYDTYGFPADLTADIARELDLTLDMEGFEREMDAQRHRARSASQFKMSDQGKFEVDRSTQFTGYDHIEQDATVVALFQDGEPVNMLPQGAEGAVVLDNTPFYAESGGQVGDAGVLEEADVRFEVSDTQKVQNNVFLHIGRMSRGELAVGDTITASIDMDKRRRTMYNHSATHLMHAALRQVLGDHVQQKGSLVDEDRLRFDFSHYEAVTPEQLRRIEDLVNEQIRLNNPVQAQVMAMDDARKTGAMMLFGEKYGDEVRVLSMGDFSCELCGGTHVNRTGDIGVFKIISESGVASGVRRIEAVTGDGALDVMRAQEQQLHDISRLMKGDTGNIADKVAQLMNKQRQLEKELEQLKGKLASAAGGDLAASAEDVNGIKVVAARLDGVDPKSLRETVDQLKNKLGSAAIVLATVTGGKVSLCAGVTKDNTGQLKAGELVNFVARQVGGKGGGRPDMAMAGGNEPEQLDVALAAVTDWVQQQLG
jgi:alanyl-tRNA synthetase